MRACSASISLSAPPAGADPSADGLVDVGEGPHAVTLSAAKGLGSFFANAGILRGVYPERNEKDPSPSRCSGSG